MTVRLTILMGRFPTRMGGTENLVAALCPLLAERGVDITIVSRRNPTLPATTPGARIVQAPTRSGKVRGSASFLRTALEELRRDPPDVIHAQSLLSPTTAAIIGGRRLGIPVVATIHGGGDGGELDRLSKLRRGGRVRLALIRRGVDRFVVISDEIDRELEAIGVEPHQRRAVRNGVDTVRFAPVGAEERACLRARFGLGEDPTAVYVGRLVARKGVETLLEAFGQLRSSLPRARLLVVGEGPLLQAYEAQAGDGVVFLGALDDVTGPLRAADVFVLPSQAEGMPISLLEAMACELAVVATDVGAVREVIGSAGRVIRPDHPAELTSAMTELLTDPERCRGLGRRARRRVVDSYALTAAADELVALYEELIDSAR